MAIIFQRFCIFGGFWLLKECFKCIKKKDKKKRLSNLANILFNIRILFILALKLSSPDTSRQGNYFGIAGMIIAIVVTFLSIGNFSTSLVYVIIFLVIGGAIGAL